MISVYQDARQTRARISNKRKESVKNREQ